MIYYTVSAYASRLDETLLFHDSRAAQRYDLQRAAEVLGGADTADIVHMREGDRLHAAFEFVRSTLLTETAGTTLRDVMDRLGQPEAAA